MRFVSTFDPEKQWQQCHTQWFSVSDRVRVVCVRVCVAQTPLSPGKLCVHCVCTKPRPQQNAKKNKNKTEKQVNKYLSPPLRSPPRTSSPLRYHDRNLCSCLPVDAVLFFPPTKAKGRLSWDSVKPSRQIAAAVKAAVPLTRVIIHCTDKSASPAADTSHYTELLNLRLGFITTSITVEQWTGFFFFTESYMATWLHRWEHSIITQLRSSRQVMRINLRVSDTFLGVGREVANITSLVLLILHFDDAQWEKQLTISATSHCIVLDALRCCVTLANY